MEIQDFIVHHIEKKPQDSNIDLKTSPTTLVVNDSVIDLANKLHTLYNKSSITYAEFKKQEQNTFNTHFKEYLHKNTSFLDLSLDTAKILKSILKKSSAARGGYLVYFDYKTNIRRYFSIFLIRNTKGITFERSSNLDPFSIIHKLHLDLSKVAYACRIEINNTHDNIAKVSLIKKRQHKISDYFFNWINATSSIDNKTLTKNLRNISTTIPLPKNIDGSEMSRHEFRKNIYTFITSLTDQNDLDIRNLSNHLYDDINFIQNFALEQGIQIDTIFKPDKKTLQELFKYSFNTTGLKLEFTHQLWADGEVYIDEEEDDLVIIRSKKLVNQIRERMDL